METTIIERIKGFANMIGINQKTLNQQLNAKRGVSLLNCRAGNCSGSSNLPSSATEKKALLNGKAFFISSLLFSFLMSLFHFQHPAHLHIPILSNNQFMASDDLVTIY